MLTVAEARTRSLTGCVSSVFCEGRWKREGSIDDFEEGSLFAKDQALCLCHEKVCTSFGIGSQAGSVIFVGSESIEGDQTPGDIVGSFVGEKVADEMSSATRDDVAPVFCILVEFVSLERVDLVTDEACDLHGVPFGGRYSLWGIYELW